HSRLAPHARRGDDNFLACRGHDIRCSTHQRFPWNVARRRALALYLPGAEPPASPSSWRLLHPSRSNSSTILPCHFYFPARLLTRQFGNSPAPVRDSVFHLPAKPFPRVRVPASRLPARQTFAIMITDASCH